MSLPLPISNYSLSQLQQIYNELWKYRMFKDQTLREIANFINPDMSDWYLRSDPQQSGRAPNTGVKLFDWTGPESSSLCVDGLMGYALTRTGVWFRTEFDDEKQNENAFAFLQKCERQMYKQLQLSPFYDEARIFLRSLLDFSTALMWRQENAAVGRPSYKTLHLNRCYIANNEWGDVDVLLRDIWMSTQNVVAEYGLENCPLAIQDAYRMNKQQQWMLVSFAIPQRKYDLDFEAPAGEYAEITVPMCSWYEPMRIDAHYTKPFFAARYMRSYDAGPWGLGAPGMLQLGNVKMLNAMSQDMLRLSQRMADPPIKATIGARGRINRVPGNITYLPPGTDYQPERFEGDPRMLEQRYLTIQKNVKSGYHEDFFLVLTNNLEAITKSTATGVQGLQGEKAAMLSAFSSRLSYEFLEPLLKDLFFTELRAGRFGTPPRQAMGRQMKLDFVGPLWQMQRQQLVLNATMSALQQIGALVQMQLAAGQPGDVLDNFDLSAYARDIAVSYDVAKDVLRNMVDVSRIRQGRAAAAQQQAQLQQKETESRMFLERARASAAQAKGSTSAQMALPQPATAGLAVG